MFHPRKASYGLGNLTTPLVFALAKSGQAALTCQARLPAGQLQVFVGTDGLSDLAWSLDTDPETGIFHLNAPFQRDLALEFS